MKKPLIILAVGLLIAFTTNAQYLSLSWDGEPIGDTLVVYGAQTDAEIVAHAIVTNVSDHNMYVKVLRQRLFMQEETLSQFCWGVSCYPPSVDLSFDSLMMAPDQSTGDEDFSGHYIPNGVWGDSYIEYTFFNTSNESENVKLVVQYSATTTDIEENIEAKVSVFPNPADNFVNIVSDSRIERVSIFDLTGKTIYNQAADQYRTKLNIDYLQRGIYLIKLETENGTKVEKLNVR